jgi:hypothetical protein
MRSQQVTDQCIIYQVSDQPRVTVVIASQKWIKGVHYLRTNPLTAFSI